jgi:regulatory factor X
LAQQPNGTRGGSQDRQSGQEDDEEDEDSEGHTSKRNSLALPGTAPQVLQSNAGAKNPKSSFDMDLSDKTPTSNTLMSSAQQAAAVLAAQQKPGLAGHASIRRQSTIPEASTLAARPSPPSQAFSEQFIAPNQRASVRQLPNFPTVEEALGPSSTSVQGQIAREVWGWFENHLDMLLDSARSLKFDLFEIHLRNFWQGLSGDHREVVHAPAMAGLMSRADAMVYDVGTYMMDGA